MNYREILNIIKEMNRTDLTRIEIEEEGFKIRIEKETALSNSNQALYPNQAPVPAINREITAQPQTAMLHSQNTGSNAHEEKNDDETNYKKIVSPMVGTFYTSPAPDKPAFVKAGDMVKKGQTVCIIEAMKLMNEIESDYDGEIVRVLVNNEEMVQYGQPLFLIK